MTKSTTVALTLALTAAASADLGGTAVEVGPEQHPDPGIVTLRISLVFDDELDQVLAISGDPDVMPLLFETDGAALRENCNGQIIAGQDLCACDFRSDGDLGGDSWVNLGLEIGQGAGGGIGPCDKNGCCIVGSRFECDDNCGYFDPNPGTQELPDEQGRVRIAQFSLPDGACFTYGGTVSFNLGGGDLTSRAFLLEHCVCRGDLDASGAVDFDDLLEVLANWGPQESCPPSVPADLDKDCAVGFSDLLIVLNAWGPCE